MSRCVRSSIFPERGACADYAPIDQAPSLSGVGVIGSVVERLLQCREQGAGQHVELARSDARERERDCGHAAAVLSVNAPQFRRCGGRFF